MFDCIGKGCCHYYLNLRVKSHCPNSSPTTFYLLDVEQNFTKHDVTKTGFLDEHEAMMFLEHRNETKTALELRGLLADIDKNKDHKLNFLEWCCFYFNKSYDDLNDFTDEEARQKAMKAAAEAAAMIKAAEEKIAAAKKAEEDAKAKEEADIAAEKEMTGVKGAAAFFKRQAMNNEKSSMGNKERVQAESARKRELKAAKEAEEKAKKEVVTTKTAEEIAAEIAEKARIAEEEKAAAEKAAKDKEIADRKARIAARNKAFEEGSLLKKGTD